MFIQRKAKLMTDVQSILKADVALIMSPIHIYYYTGFLSNPHERFFALFVDTQRQQTTLFVPTLDETAAKQVGEVDELIPISDAENPYTLLKRSLSEGVETIAIEKSYLSVMAFEQIHALAPTATFVDIGPYIQGERVRKSPDEIRQVRKAMQITEIGLKNTIQTFKPGMTELQVKAELEYQLTMLGADGLAFDSLVLSGKNTALPHGTSSDTEINAGDFLLFDLGVQINGYHSDITRTFVVGKSTAQQEEMYQTVKQANERAISQVKLGVPLQQIDLVARDYITENGYGQYFTHRIGHGLGLEAHEPPSIHQENEETVKSGLLFTIEPGIYIPGIGGVRIEDDLYVHEHGEVEVLTTFPKILMEI